MIRRIGLPLAFLALFVVAGGHWAVLQTVAWTGMLADHLRGGSVAQAVSETFDGAHPCPLCLQVEKGKQQEQKIPALVQSEKKADAFLFGVPLSVPPPGASAAVWPRGAVSCVSAPRPAPPLPPPRLLAA